MQVTIIEDSAVSEAGAVLATRNGQTIIVMDPGLSDGQKYRLLRELLDG